MAQKVADYFKSNIARKKVFATADGFLFEAKQDAKSHSKTLENKNVETFTKSGKVATEETKEVTIENADKNSAGKPKNPATTGADQKTVK